MGTSDRTDQGKKLETYWREIGTKTQGIPFRSDFRVTSEIAPLLPFLVIVEALENDIVFRLVGTGLAEHQGIDITGRRYSDFSRPDQVVRALARIRAAHAQPCGLRTIHTEEYARGIASEVEVAAFPLRGDDNGSPMMVMVVTPVGRGISEKGGKALYLKPLSSIDYIDLGNGIPDDEDVLAGTTGAWAAKR
ncbi:PAS domain-containing protein [Parvibaculum sp.]|uniref:PAS domain-containing protein n=1 Tax=Parvibaculum sp. TaxID=2024848 RepID=UPI003919716A